MRILVLEAQAPRFKTVIRFVDREAKWTWPKVVKKIVASRDYASVDLAYRMVKGGDACIGDFMWMCLGKTMWSRIPGHPTSRCSEMWGAPSKFEGWINGVRGVRYYAYNYDNTHVHARLDMQLQPKLGTFWENGCAAVQAANGPLGPLTPVPMEKWPEVAVVWDHDTEVVGKHWTLTVPKPEIMEELSKRKIRKEFRTDVSSLSWMILKGVPKCNRSDKLQRLFAH